MAELESIPVVFKSAMGTQEWELNVPLDVPIMLLIRKIVREPDLGFRECDDNGTPIPYRLMHHEASRYLAESETLRKARVKANETLVLVHQAWTDTQRTGSARSKEHRATLNLFFCYSHRDEGMREKLEEHLSLLRRQGVIAGWHDRRIVAGQEWKVQIDQHLDSAAIILLLVSPSFMASDYCYDKEMTRALERHNAGTARVIPIILRPVNWQMAPFGHLQALPRNGKPVVKWTHKDDAFMDIARGIEAAAEFLSVRP